MPQYPIGKGGRFESEQVGNDEWDRHLPVALKLGACPGGEGAVLKTVGLKRFAGSNPVCSAYAVLAERYCTRLESGGLLQGRDGSIPSHSV